MILHGIFDSADSFAVMKNSSAHYFLRKGFEVWFGNNRGNKYSCLHEKWTTQDPEYWNFSFQEMAEFDVPLFVKTVKTTSQVNKITVLTHSQGGTQMFAALSENQEVYDSIGNFNLRSFHSNGTCFIFRHNS